MQKEKDYEEQIYIHQRIDNHPISKKPKAFHLLTYCLLSANTEDIKDIWRNKEIIVKKGSFIVGINQLSHDTGLNLKEVKTALKILRKFSMIRTIERKTKYEHSFFITCNFAEHQNLFKME